MKDAVLFPGRRYHDGDLGRRRRLKGRIRRLLLLEHDLLLREGLLLEAGLALALHVRLGVGDDPLLALEVVALAAVEDAADLGGRGRLVAVGCRAGAGLPPFLGAPLPLRMGLEVGLFHLCRIEFNAFQVISV